MLTNKEIVTRCPSAGATGPAAHCSAKYSFVPTMSMVEVLREEGFVPVEARQDARRPDRWGNEQHARHMIKMRIAGTDRVSSQKVMMAGAVPELLLVNSSDGSCQFQLKLGLFRMVCSNGLIIMSAIDSVIRTHKALDAAEVIARARALSANTKPLFDKIKTWEKIRLNPLAQRRFAEQALVLRVGAARVKTFDLDTALAVRRPEDAEPTLWNIFNRVQEACMQGHIRSKAEAPRAISLGHIRAIGAELDFNEQLWAQAERWAGLVKS